jgi:hypothetical protein
MITVRLILLVLAFVSLALGAASRVNLVALGLALWVLAIIVG